MPSSADGDANLFGYKLQNLLNMYYSSIPVNASFFTDVMNAKMTASNGMSMADNIKTNVLGLGKQASLCTLALMDAYSMIGSSDMGCSYLYPAAMIGTEHLMNA